MYGLFFHVLESYLLSSVKTVIFVISLRQYILYVYVYYDLAFLTAIWN